MNGVRLRSPQLVLGFQDEFRRSTCLACHTHFRFIADVCGFGCYSVVDLSLTWVEFYSTLLTCSYSELFSDQCFTVFGPVVPASYCQRRGLCPSWKTNLQLLEMSSGPYRQYAVNASIAGHLAAPCCSDYCLMRVSTDLSHRFPTRVRQVFLLVWTVTLIKIACQC